ncbi:ATP-binding protein [Hydrogenophaga sp.]|uniref:ATP-binding protein n=1 Tax=Hydrogenophaga sp. TaxID=1904254 RepID=UPI0035B2FA33
MPQPPKPTEITLDDGLTADSPPPHWRSVMADRGVLVPVFIALLMAGWLAFGLITLRQQSLESEGRMLGALSAALADQADSALSAAQTAMRATAEELAAGNWEADTDVAEALLRARGSAVPALRQMLLLDTQGEVISAADDRIPDLDYRQLDLFRIALAAAPGTAHLGAPLSWPDQPSPWIPLSMPWFDANGRLGGVVVMAADTTLLYGGFERTRPSPDVALLVLRSDGSPLVGEHSARTEALATALAQAGERTGQSWRELPLASDPPSRWLVADHTMRRAPLTVVLSRDTQGVLREWRTQAWLVGSFALSALLVTWGLSLRHAREQRWRENSQRDLQRQRERATRAFLAAREGLWEWNPATRRHYLSPRMRALLGFEPNAPTAADQPLGWPERLASAERQRLQEAIAQHLREHTADFSATVLVTPPDHAPRHVQVRGQALQDALGQMQLVAGTAYDVSDEVAAAEKTRLLDEQLQRARRLEALGTLAGGVAHDFNNVLAAILGFGERAQAQAPEGSALRRHLDQIVRAGERGKTLVERVMAFSRSGASQAQTYWPKALVQEAWQLTRDSSPPGVALELAPGADDPALRGDGVAFFEASLNLMRNAVQAVGEQGHVQVSLQVLDVTKPQLVWHGRLTPGRWLRLRVQDDGPGIAAPDLPHLLEPFFTTKTGSGGTGLGLAVVHAMVRDAQGALDIRTAPGEGTEIDVYLPVPPADTAGTGLPTGPIPQGQGQVVMVVDDEAALVELAEEWLAELGLEPRGFTDPEKAWATFSADPTAFDVLITDQMMPGLDGLALVTRCKALAPGLRTAVVTGFGGDDFSQRAQAAGVDKVLAKPLSAAALAEALGPLLAPRADAGA